MFTKFNFFALVFAINLKYCLMQSNEQSQQQQEQQIFYGSFLNYDNGQPTQLTLPQISSLQQNFIPTNQNQLQQQFNNALGYNLINDEVQQQQQQQGTILPQENIAEKTFNEYQIILRQWQQQHPNQSGPQTLQKLQLLNGKENIENTQSTRRQQQQQQQSVVVQRPLNQQQRRQQQQQQQPAITFNTQFLTGNRPITMRLQQQQQQQQPQLQNPQQKYQQAMMLQPQKHLSIEQHLNNLVNDVKTGTILLNNTEQQLQLQQQQINNKNDNSNNAQIIVRGNSLSKLPSKTSATPLLLTSAIIQKPLTTANQKTSTTTSSTTSTATPLPAATATNQNSFKPLLPVEIIENPLDKDNITTAVHICKACCIPNEDPCSNCCDTSPFLNILTLKSTAG